MFKFYYWFVLNVPYKDKAIAKAHKARWDPDLKKWYIKCNNLEDYKEFAKVLSVDYVNSNSLSEDFLLCIKKECDNIFLTHQLQDN